MSSDQNSADRLTVRLKGPLAQALDFSTLQRKKPDKIPATMNPRDVAVMSGAERERAIRPANHRDRQNSPKIGYTTDPPYPRMSPTVQGDLARRKVEQHVAYKPPRSKLVSPPGIRETQRMTQDATMAQRRDRVNVNDARARYGLAPLPQTFTHTTQRRNQDLGIKDLVPRDQYHALNFVRRLQGKAIVNTQMTNPYLRRGTPPEEQKIARTLQQRKDEQQREHAGMFDKPKSQLPKKIQYKLGNRKYNQHRTMEPPVSLRFERNSPYGGNLDQRTRWATPSERTHRLRQNEQRNRGGGPPLHHIYFHAPSEEDNRY